MSRLRFKVILLGVATVVAILSCNDSNKQAIDDTTDTDKIDIDVIIPIDDDVNNDSSGTDAEDTDTASDEDVNSFSCANVDVVDLGSESCPNPSDEKMYIHYAIGWTNFQSTLMQGSSGNISFVIESVKEVNNPGIIACNAEKGVRLTGKCIGEVGPNGENECFVEFAGYDKSLFNEASLIGQELTIYQISGFYGSIHGEWEGRDLNVVKKQDGTLVSVSGQAVVDEDGEKDYDVKVWPSELVPGITGTPSIPKECAICECRRFRDVPDDGSEESIRWDVLVAPPIKFVRDGKEIIVRNGDVITEDGYIYNVKRSWMVHEKDPDQMMNTSGKPYSFDFTIVNTEALK